MPTARIELENQSWDEQPVAEWEGGGRVARADIVQAASGDATGTAKTWFVMCYSAANSAEYVGMVRLEGALGGRDGSVVLESTGTFDGEAASGTVHVVAGTGAGALAGLRGDGKFHAPKGPKATLTLDYTLE